MALDFGQVVEGVGAAQLAGMDQAHEQIANLGSGKGAIKQGILTMKNYALQGPFTMLLSSGAPTWGKNNVSGSQCRSR